MSPFPLLVFLVVVLPPYRWTVSNDAKHSFYSFLAPPEVETSSYLAIDPFNEVRHVRLCYARFQPSKHMLGIFRQRR